MTMKFELLVVRSGEIPPFSFILSQKFVFDLEIDAAVVFTKIPNRLKFNAQLGIEFLIYLFLFYCIMTEIFS